MIANIFNIKIQKVILGIVPLLVSIFQIFLKKVNWKKIK